MLCTRSLQLPLRAIKAQLHCSPRSAPHLKSRLESVASVRAAATGGETAMELPADLDSGLLSLISSIHHQSDTKAVLHATGGAAQAMSWLLVVPGASNTVLEASVLYARESLLDLLGQEPEQYCSSGTAALMAHAAYKRAAQLSSFGGPIVGLGATCSLASVPLKRGQHRAHVACHLPDGSTRVTSLTLAKGARSRLQEDSIASLLVIKMIADASGVDSTSFRIPFINGASEPSAASSPDDVIPVHDVIEVHETAHSGLSPLEELIAGRAHSVEYSGGRVFVDAPRRRKVVLPGSFNPLHDGHKEMLKAALEAAGPGYEACFELALGNPDKGTISLEEAKKRISQFESSGLSLIVTCAALFTQKAEIAQHCKFVVGYDTAYRLVMPKYYSNSNTQMLLDFARLRNLGCAFIVAGRKDDADGGKFKGLDDVVVPPELTDLFQGIPEAQFRADVSSTELRKAAMEANRSP